MRAMSSRQAPSGLARELLEEIDSPCLGTSEISTGGGDGKLGWMSFAPLDDPHHPLRRNCIVCFWAPIVLPSERSQVKSCVPESDPTSPSMSPMCPPNVCRVRTSVTRFQINRDRDRLFLNWPCS